MCAVGGLAYCVERNPALDIEKHTAIGAYARTRTYTDDDVLHAEVSNSSKIVILRQNAFEVSIHMTRSGSHTCTTQFGLINRYMNTYFLGKWWEEERRRPKTTICTPSGMIQHTPFH